MLSNARAAINEKHHTRNKNTINALHQLRANENPALGLLDLKFHTQSNNFFDSATKVIQLPKLVKPPANPREERGAAAQVTSRRTYELLSLMPTTLIKLKKATLSVILEPKLE